MSVTPMMKQYNQIKKEHPNTILLFRLGDFYEMFGEDAKVASKILDITLTARDAGAAERIPMCGVPYHAITGYLDKLIKSGQRVAVCEQLEDPKQAKGVVKRDVVRVITPGTFLEGNVEGGNNTYLVGLVSAKHSYGLGFMDLSTGEFRVTSIEGWAGVRDELLRLQPAEILVPDSMVEINGIQEIAQSLGAVCSTVDSRWCQASAGRDLLLDHFKMFSLDGFGISNSQEIAAAGMLLQYAQQTQKGLLEHIQQVRRYHRSDILQIDSISQRNLELVKTIRDGKKKGSLLGVIDKTQTSMGSRMLRKWVEQPLVNIEHINERQNSVAFLVENTMTCLETIDLLRDIHDLERLLSRLVSGSGNARDLIALSESLKMVPRLKGLLGTSDDLLLRQTSNGLDELRVLTDLIDRAIQSEPPISLRDGNLIKEGFNRELDALRDASRNGKQWIKSLEVKERERTGVKSLKVGFNKVFGYYIEVTRANSNQVPEDYQRKQTLANAERYITPELKEKESLILGAEEKIVALEYQLFVEVRDQVRESITSIQGNAHSIATIDVLQGLAVAATEGMYCQPEMVDGIVLDIHEGRHPVIESLHPDFVPNDTMFDASQSVILLTGPNMAGKSTYLRQTALIVIMAQIGSFVPATKAKIGIVDKIFTRIGAADDLSTGQSTFMVECAETANLLCNATVKSLLILDELGRGTSTYDGMAIAQGVIEHIHDSIMCRTLFSTHYHELTKLEESLSRLTTYRIEVEEKQGRVFFLHKVSKGITDRSYGINVAKMAGIPQKVIRRSLELLHKLESMQKKPVQLNLFNTAQYFSTSDSEQKIADALRELNINELSPLKALNILAELKQELEREES